jgi:CheY-like chemotaxis protein
MVVDDEPVIRMVLTEYLSECGYHTLSVASGDDAKEMIGKGIAVDLVFSDVRMAGILDGFGLARWLLAHHPRIPVILATGDVGKANAATELCGVEMMQKPYDFQAAEQKITETIHRHRA